MPLPLNKYCCFLLQVILKATSGIDFAEFYHFMHCIADHRIHDLELLRKTHVVDSDFIRQPNTRHCKANISFEASTHGVSENMSSNSSNVALPRTVLEQVTFDLNRVKAVVDDMILLDEFSWIDCSSNECSPCELVEKISKALLTADKSDT